MNKQYLDINGNQMAFLRFGEGSKLLIALPGYGDRAVLFKNIEKSLSRKYKVYVLQLPLHGASVWEENMFSKADFIEAIRQVMAMEGQEKLTLMGYSFGGRAVLSMLDLLLGKVEHIFLLAPDGFNSAYVQRATFLPRSIRLFLQSILKNPNWYLRALSGLHRIGLLKPYSYLFAQRHLATEKRRKRLFLYWNSLDEFVYDEDTVASVLDKNKISVTLVLGKEDKVIPTEQWIVWGEATAGVEVHLLEEKHKVVGRKMDDLFGRIL